MRNPHWKPPRVAVPKRFTDAELDLVATWKLLQGFEAARKRVGAEQALDDVREFVGEERGCREDFKDDGTLMNFSDIRADRARLVRKFRLDR